MRELLELAASQHALFGRWQAAAFGVSWRQLDTRVRRGDLELWSDRVLRVCGSPTTPEQDLMGGVLDAGPGAVVTTRSAGWLWRLPGFVPSDLDVVRARGQEARRGVRSRWPRHVPSRHVTVVRGIPVFTMARTVFELAGALHHQSLLDRLLDGLHDARRDAEALAAGFREIVRITEEQVWYDPPTVRRVVLDTRRRHTRTRSA